MIKPSASISKSLKYTAGLLLFAGIAVWAFFQIQEVMNGDHIWLSEALRRYLFEGLSMSEGWYELNPPLVIFIYTAPVLLAHFIQAPLFYTIFLQSLLAVGVVACILAKLWRHWSFLSRYDITVLVAAFLVANTILADSMLGERDQWAGIGLVLLTTLQISLTWDLKRPAPLAMWLLCFMGAWLILLKPHFGLLPVLLLTYRWLSQRRWPSLQDYDFTALTAATVLYGGLTLILFPDYREIILPDVVGGYVLIRENKAVLLMLAQYLPACLLLFFLLSKTSLRGPQKFYGLFLISAAAINLVPFVVQGKGYAYHLLPVNAFLWMALGFILWHLLQDHMRQGPALIGTIVFLLIGAFAAHSDTDHSPTHAEYRELPLVKKAASACPEAPCEVLVFATDLETTQKIVYYAGAHNASRYPSLWPLPPLLARINSIPPSPDAERQLALFSERVAADLRKYKPALIMVADVQILRDKPVVNPMALFSAYSPAFRTEWLHYQMAGSQTVPYKDYHAGTFYGAEENITYRFYRRQTIQP